MSVTLVLVVMLVEDRTAEIVGFACMTVTEVPGETVSGGDPWSVT